LWRWEADGTGSGSCPVVGLRIRGVETSNSTARELIYLDVREIDCEDGWWMKLALILAVLNL
jgi:hypothetical protein